MPCKPNEPDPNWRQTCPQNAGVHPGKILLEAFAVHCTKEEIEEEKRVQQE